MDTAIPSRLALRIAARAPAAGAKERPLTVGLCGSQGSGKSTLTAVLKRLLEARGLTVAALSLDDLYLPLNTRIELAREVHPLLRTRGVPGTHDIKLGLSIFAALREQGMVTLPAFDKATDDRRPEREWLRLQAPVDVLLFEGWCVGAIPQAESLLIPPVNTLEKNEDASGVWRRYVNRALADRYQALFRQIDFLILLAAPNFEVVYRWRQQQEDDLRKKVAAQGGDSLRLLDGSSLERFIAHYERLTRHILAEMPARADIVVRLDADRHGVLQERL